MKKIYIVIAAIIGVGVYIGLTASNDISNYSNFTEAITTGEKVKVVGQLAKDKEMYYDPQVDPNYFTFYMRDNDGIEKKVVLSSAKPQDFELSEQIVLTGKIQEDGDFYATDILMKCPSKYKDEEIAIKKNQG